MLCLTFPENGFNFATQKFAKNLKMPFPKAHNICFEPKLASKLLSKKLPLTKFSFR